MIKNWTKKPERWATFFALLDVAVKPQDRSELPHFKRIDTKIEIFDLAGNLQTRWHIDLANRKKMNNTKLVHFFISKVADLNHKLIEKKN